MIINISDLENVKFNNNDVEVLIVDGVKVWEKITIVDDESFNYVGIDVNGKLEGQTGFDGNIISYGIGKIEITTSDTGTQTIKYLVAGGFSDDYYGYDFRTSVSLNDDAFQVIPDDIVVPSSYKGKPVTHILNNAFSGGINYASSGGSSMWNQWSQACYIKSITLPSTLKNIGNNAIHLVQLNKDIVLHEGLETLGSYAIADFTSPSNKLIIPSTVTSFSSSSIIDDGIGNGFSTQFRNNLVIQSPVITLTTNGNTFSYAKSVVFESSVQSITGCIAYNNSPKSFVFRHTNADTITLSLSKPKSATAVNIYTDNDYIKTYDWASMNYTATFYPLSDYVE